MSKKIITGVKPTGSSMHLGNLMGAVLPFAKSAKWNDAAIFIADLHAITSVKNGKTLRDQTLELAIEYLAIYGIDTPITIFRQSDITDITRLMWILTNVTPYSLMLRAHSFKDSEAKNIDLNMWVFNYPILMAADILGYDCEWVPVGKDQIQHLEMTRDIARAFNKTYGQDVFVEPEAIIEESVATLPGIDGRKMSKSYDNFIGVFDDEKTMKKRVMSITTGSEWIDEKKKIQMSVMYSISIRYLRVPKRLHHFVLSMKVKISDSDMVMQKQNFWMFSRDTLHRIVLLERNSSMIFHSSRQNLQNEQKSWMHDSKQRWRRWGKWWGWIRIILIVIYDQGNKNSNPIIMIIAVI